MRVRDAIKLGIGFYIGMEFAKGFDEGLGKACGELGLFKKFDEAVAKFKPVRGIEKPEEKAESIHTMNPIGFRKE